MTHQKLLLFCYPELYLTNQRKFITDSGADRSVIPFDLVPSAIILPCDVRLSDVGGNKLDTFGHCYAEVGVKIWRRNF